VKYNEYKPRWMFQHNYIQILERILKNKQLIPKKNHNKIGKLYPTMKKIKRRKHVMIQKLK